MWADAIRTAGSRIARLSRRPRFEAEMADELAHRIGCTFSLVDWNRLGNNVATTWESGL